VEHPSDIEQEPLISKWRAVDVYTVFWFRDGH